MYLSDEGENFLDMEAYDRDFFLPFQSIKKKERSQSVHVEKLIRNVQRFQARVEEDREAVCRGNPGSMKGEERNVRKIIQLLPAHEEQ